MMALISLLFRADRIIGNSLIVTVCIDFVQLTILVRLISRKEDVSRLELELAFTADWGS